MNLDHAQFQSLSQCEAMAMQHIMGRWILQAYEAGTAVMLEYYDMPIEKLMMGHARALRGLGFDMTDAQAISLLAFKLRDQVVKEEGR